MDIQQAYVQVRALETITNYARADTPLLQTDAPLTDTPVREYMYYDDRQFWSRLQSDQKPWTRTFFFSDVILSEWVARIPGAYWKPDAPIHRNLSPSALEVTGPHSQYMPSAKSQRVVFGGIGTLRLPPTPDGSRLITLMTSRNASAGVPALITADVWTKICGARGSCEGIEVAGEARWQPMAQQWASNFPSTKGVVRGYLVLDHPDRIHHKEEPVGTIVHTCTVMEYQGAGTELFDFVYATMDPQEVGARMKLEDFFDRYKDYNERYGRYLLSGDMVEPMWTADFDTPAALRSNDASARSQLSLLEKRLAERIRGNSTIEALLTAVCRLWQTEADLRRISEDIDVRPGLWLRSATHAEQASQFVDYVSEHAALEALIEQVRLAETA